MKRLLTVVLCILFALSLFASPDKVRMISIGIDYSNSPSSEDMALNGTINDATEMTAAIQNIMEAKGVEFESVLMLQEGSGDYYVEVEVLDKSKDLKLLKAVEEVFLTLNSDSMDTTEYLGDDGYHLVCDRMDEETLGEVYDKLEALDNGKGNIDFHYFDIKDMPTYPSGDNVLNQIMLSTDLDYDDLLIVYYSGHGGSEKAFTNYDMENLLLPYVRNGGLSREEMNEVLDMLTLTENTVIDRLAYLGVEEETIYNILDDMEKSEEYYKTGTLATAYTLENYFTDCSTLEMYMVFTALSYLKCDCVLIIDSCFSGYAADNLSDYLDEDDYDHAVNIEVMSAATDDETSEEVAFETEDGEWECHGAFTYEVLRNLGWEHNTEEKTVIYAGTYEFNDDFSSVIDATYEREVSGYTRFIPERQTATDFFNKVLENWDMDEQHPQDGESTYLLYFIP